MVEKIDGTTLKTYKMIISTFSISNKNNKVKFFEKSFLLVDVKPDIVLGMFFLIIGNINIDF